VAFPVPITSVLSGASVDQLAYWRKKTATARPLLVPETKAAGRFLYSWADVLALRTIAYLRSEKSLPRIRAAVDTLRRLEASEWDHLASYTLVSTPTSIFVQTPRGALLDLQKHPGTVLDETLMRDVMEPFRTKSGRRVPALERPRPQLRVHPSILGGYPVVADTRVPFDVVAGLAEEGWPAAEIISLYPTVEVGAIRDARAFAKQVANAVR
jgi:uncharacterized protein (DUF433 family)/DNA-binding transcriptional MerR regulator